MYRSLPERMASMLSLHATGSFSATRWNSRRILFTITENGCLVPCAISEAALEQVSQHRCADRGDAMAHFAAFQVQIEAAAHSKFEQRNPASHGAVNLWAEDFDDYSPEGAPMMAERLDWTQAA
jgi:hypothetical protein